ncbi:MAG: hypothetical protein PVF70_06320 [Anaerolineales bacterium]|jgi:hypothetical protein
MSIGLRTAAFLKSLRHGYSAWNLKLSAGICKRSLGVFHASGDACGMQGAKMAFLRLASRGSG